SASAMAREVYWRCFSWRLRSARALGPYHCLGIGGAVNTSTSLAGAMTSTAAIEEGVLLSRHTTLGTGGPARFFARPGTLDELIEGLAGAREERHGVETIGLGSNLLVHDDGVDAVVLRLGGELAAAHVEGAVLVAG